VDIDDGETVWRFDGDFLRSNWTCIWGRGCQGILARPAPELGEGCCSIGAHLDDVEAPNISALAATLDPTVFEHHADAIDGGIFSDASRSNTRVVDGACIFLNRPGFPGGAGCALHVAALRADEPALEWKPSVCWQLPIKVDWAAGPDGREVASVHRWTRADWGEQGEEMAWCCTEGDLAYVGDHPVIDSLREELTEIVGVDVYVELRRRIVDEPPSTVEDADDLDVGGVGEQVDGRQ
jgi:hypothetical protein